MLELPNPIEDTYVELQDGTGQFVPAGYNGTYRFEHSLYSISLFEAKYRKPFFSKESTQGHDIFVDYITMCSLDGNPPPYSYIANAEVNKRFNDYLLTEHTATVIKDEGGTSSSRFLTSELIYGYMAVAEIPFECDRWNISRLLTLLQVVSALKSPPKKMSNNEIMNQNKKLNEQRRKEMNSKG